MLTEPHAKSRERSEVCLGVTAAKVSIREQQFSDIRKPKVFEYLERNGVK